MKNEKNKRITPVDLEETLSDKFMDHLDQTQWLIDENLNKIMDYYETKEFGPNKTLSSLCIL